MCIVQIDSVVLKSVPKIILRVWKSLVQLKYKAYIYTIVYKLKSCSIISVYDILLAGFAWVCYK